LLPLNKTKGADRETHNRANRMRGLFLIALGVGTVKRNGYLLPNFQNPEERTHLSQKHNPTLSAFTHLTCGSVRGCTHEHTHIHTLTYTNTPTD
jgi:hypothetical protein